MFAPCIYCGDRLEPRTAEHVLQAGFGTRLVLTEDVCGGCNSATSANDQKLVELTRGLGGGDVRRLLGRGRYVPAEGEPPLIARLENGIGVPFPQLIAVDGRWRFTGAPGDADTMLTEIAAPGCTVATVVDPSGPVRVVRSKYRTYCVHAPTAERATQLATLLHEEGFGECERGTPRERPAISVANGDEVPPMDFEFTLAVGSVSRALAKVALNFLCFRLGGDAARNAAFDPIRRFARYGEGHWANFVVLRLLDRSLDDLGRFYVAPETHALVLQEIEDTPLAVIVLYGEVAGAVRLTAGVSAPGSLPKGTWLVSYFRGADVEHLRAPDDGMRCFVNAAEVMAETAPHVPRRA